MQAVMCQTAAVCCMAGEGAAWRTELGKFPPRAKEPGSGAAAWLCCWRPLALGLVLTVMHVPPATCHVIYEMPQCYADAAERNLQGHAAAQPERTQT